MSRAVEIKIRRNLNLEIEIYVENLNLEIFMIPSGGNKKKNAPWETRKNAVQQMP